MGGIPCAQRLHGYEGAVRECSGPLGVYVGFEVYGRVSVEPGACSWLEGYIPARGVEVLLGMELREASRIICARTTERRPSAPMRTLQVAVVASAKVRVMGAAVLVLEDELLGLTELGERL
jgi:hypothetical protein